MIIITLQMVLLFWLLLLSIGTLVVGWWLIKDYLIYPFEKISPITDMINLILVVAIIGFWIITLSVPNTGFQTILWGIPSISQVVK